jgi:hypothetical protein
VDPIVVTATRTGAFGLSEMELLVLGSVIVVALVGWMFVARTRRGQQPHA